MTLIESIEDKKYIIEEIDKSIRSRLLHFNVRSGKEIFIDSKHSSGALISIDSIQILLSEDILRKIEVRELINTMEKKNGI